MSRGRGAAALNNAEPTPGRAWQPLTFGGVARFAHDWIGRLLVTALIVAALAASAFVVACHWTWAPIIEEAIAKLPATAEIRAGNLNAPAASTLGESPFLAIRLNPQDAAMPPSTSDLQIELGKNDARFRSMLGTASVSYQSHWTIGLSRGEREPWWGAWKPAALAWLWVGTVVYLLGSWIGLALLYFIPARIAGFYADRDVSLFGAWKMCVAALMPGAVLVSIAILLYGAAQIRLLELIAAFVLHLALGVLFVVGGLMRLPRVIHKVENPFEPEEPGQKPPPVKESKNPFSRGGAEK